MAFQSTQAAPASASKVEASAIRAGALSPTSNIGNTDNFDVVSQELVGNQDATAARIAHVTRTKATGVSVSPTSATKAAAATQQLTPTVTPGGASITGVTYRSSNPELATVNASGLVTSVAPGAKAQVTLTSDATNVSDADTVTIGSTVYRFKNTTAAAYDVKIGASAAVTLDNLKSAVNASGAGNGTDYHTGTLIHPTVTATTNTDTTQLFVAKAAGLPGNSIASTEASTHLSFGSATLLGGTLSVATITVETNDGHFTADSLITTTA